MEDEALLTTEQAATELGISERRVRKIIEDGELPARRLRREWAILRADLDAYQPKRKGPGRPRTRPTPEARAEEASSRRW